MNKHKTINPSAVLSDTVVSSLLRHETHAMKVAGSGHLAHFGPLVLIGIIIQHVFQWQPRKWRQWSISTCKDAL